MALVAGLLLAFAATGTPAAAKGDASLDNWTSNVCGGVAETLGSLNTPPEPDPAGEQIAARRYVSNLVQHANSWMLSTVRYPPPVAGGRKLRANIRRAMNDAIHEFEQAGTVLAGTELSTSVVQGAERHLTAGYDRIVTMMRRLRGHSGSARFDTAIEKNDSCDFITSLEPIGSSGAA
jgi:hypothetical protein